MSDYEISNDLKYKYGLRCRTDLGHDYGNLDVSQVIKHLDGIVEAMSQMDEVC
jgi:uncharacterized protein YutE (UPF0331/DUF86 family)